MNPIEISFPGGKRVDAAVDGQVIHTDQSREHGGEGSAPEPYSMFLASLATCAGLYALAFCQARAISTEGLRLTQHHERDVDGKLARIVLRIVLPPGFPEKYVGAIKAAVMGCRVKKTLMAPPEFVVEV